MILPDRPNGCFAINPSLDEILEGLDFLVADDSQSFLDQEFFAATAALIRRLRDIRQVAHDTLAAQGCITIRDIDLTLDPMGQQRQTAAGETRQQRETKIDHEDHNDGPKNDLNDLRNDRNAELRGDPGQ